MIFLILQTFLMHNTTSHLYICTLLQIWVVFVAISRYNTLFRHELMCIPQGSANTVLLINVL